MSDASIHRGPHRGGPERRLPGGRFATHERPGTGASGDAASAVHSGARHQAAVVAQRAGVHPPDQPRAAQRAGNQVDISPPHPRLLPLLPGPGQAERQAPLPPVLPAGGGGRSGARDQRAASAATETRLLRPHPDLLGRGAFDGGEGAATDE